MLSCGTDAVAKRSIITNMKTISANTYGRKATTNAMKKDDANDISATETAIKAGISGLSKNLVLERIA
jgi:hypothetical protein